jgi:uncharacterized protein (DUF1015 family)
MADIIPFAGICYSSGKVRADDVVAPPYDIITPEMREELYAKSPYNIARIDAGMEYPGDTEKNNKYTRAAGLLESWLEEGVLANSEVPSFYAYRVDYTAPANFLKEPARKVLSGFFGLVRLEPLGTGNIHPHECTHSRARVDRLNLLRAVRANTSPIFSVYRAPERRASAVLEKAFKTPPYMQAHDLEGNLHSLWIISSPEEVKSIQQELAGKPVFIADGHHRYETALENQRLMKEELKGKVKGDEPFNYVLMFLSNVEDGGLTILPTHRLVRSHEKFPDALKANFAVMELPSGGDIIQEIKGAKPENVFGLYIDRTQYRIAYNGVNGLADIPPVLKKLDVVVLHELIISRLAHAEAVAYEMDPALARSMVEKGEYEAAFFLNPTGIEEVMEVALSGKRMPPKSTYFYPKLVTGFVINRF